jgi:hypothetical protein
MIGALESETLPWSWSADGGIATKVLNTDPVNGARTVLLKSAPRAVNEATRRRAHYHFGAEEFLSLGSAFSFDDGYWHGRLSYAYIPPLTVHGTDVQVPDGYLLYLRTLGPAEPRFVARHGPPEFSAVGKPQPILVASPLDKDVVDIAGLPGARSRRLSQVAGESASLVFLKAGCSGPLRQAGNLCELLVAEGEVAFDAVGLGQGGYVCRSLAESGVVVTAMRDSVLMVNTLAARG